MHAAALEMTIQNPKIQNKLDLQQQKLWFKWKNKYINSKHASNSEMMQSLNHTNLKERVQQWSAARSVNMMEVNQASRGALDGTAWFLTRATELRKFALLWYYTWLRPTAKKKNRTF